MTDLNRIRPAFRTKGSMTGNFGAGQRTAGSKLADIPANQRDSIGNFPSSEEYMQRLESIIAMDDLAPRTREFVLSELRRLKSLRVQRANITPSGPHCSITDHFVTSAQ